MSIEETIRKYIKLANDERSRRIMMKKTHPSITDAELKSFEAEYRQIANWLQELKERREAEMRMNRVWKPDQGLVEPNPSEKIEGYVISPETIEAMRKLVETLTETLPEMVSMAIEKMPESIEEYFRRKEEES